MKDPAKPVPKSSSHILMPSSFRSLMQRRMSECISISSPSVISKASLLPATPVSPRMAATDVAKPGVLSWIGETLTLTTRTWLSARSSRHTVRIAQRPSSRMAPVRSATGMNRLGGTDVPSSILRRISASTASTRPDVDVLDGLIDE